MARKSKTVELAGGKGPRQLVWEFIRAHRERFTLPQVAKELGVRRSTVTEYMVALRAGGYIADIDNEAVEGGVNARLVYRLVRDNGIEAPRLTRKGEPVTKGDKQLSMWRTMHRMFQRADFSIRELAVLASTQAQPIQLRTASFYVHWLIAAGYVRCTLPAKKGHKPVDGRYMLIAERYTGPRAPMVSGTHVVYDPNEDRIVFADKEEITNGL